ncbi:MAG: hypothetical protein ACR2NM_11290, partial [Bythopirellula sp.]
MAESSPTNDSDNSQQKPDSAAQQVPAQAPNKRRSTRTKSVMSRLSTRRTFKELKDQVPSWVTSLALHIAALFALGFVTLPLATPPEISLQAAHISEDTFEMEDDLLDVELNLKQDSLDESIDEEIELEPQVEVPTDTFEQQDVTPLEMFVEPFDFGATVSDLGTLATDEGLTTSGLAGRSAASKSNLLRVGGGTKSSEKAVLQGLEWLARHQYPDGSWNFDHTLSECNGRCGNPGTATKARAAATGLALMAYLGAGHTQENGRYQRMVYNGISALGRLMKVTKNGGSFHEPEGNMYSHGIATMALCEAYAMTGDPVLREPAQAAIDFVCYAQDPTGGGWRYKPRQPGDTSVVGWQIAALKSGYLSNLNVPPLVIKRASGFLEMVLTDDGSRYAYNTDFAKGHEACTAIGVLCRMYMGAKRDDYGVTAAVDTLSKRGPLKNDP